MRTKKPGVKNVITMDDAVIHGCGPAQAGVHRSLTESTSRLSRRVLEIVTMPDAGRADRMAVLGAVRRVTAVRIQRI
jgi:hypothetical protein